jgi:hypothetical protein
MQPLVDLKVNGSDRIEVPANQSVVFTGAATAGTAHTLSSRAGCGKEKYTLTRCRPTSENERHGFEE